jgi:galactokinase
MKSLEEKTENLKKEKSNRKEKSQNIRVGRKAQVDAVVSSHVETFGREPSFVATAPCRFHLMGDRTWFFGGKTISMGMDKFVSVSVSRRNDDNLYFHSLESGETKHISLSALRFRKEDKWANSIKSVVHGFVSEKFFELTENTPGFDFCVASDFPQFSGMGVTTALKVCAASVLDALLELDCSGSEIFSVIDRGNTEFLKEGKNGVLENHFAENITAMFSRKNSVVFTDHSDKVLSQSSFTNVDFDFPGKSIVLVDTKVPRFSVWDESSIMKPEYKAILSSIKVRKSVFGGWCYDSDSEVNSALGGVFGVDNKHLLGVVKEHKFVLDAYDAMVKKDFLAFVRAVNASHNNMSELYDMSCPEIDWILRRLVEMNPNVDGRLNPVCCGRVTGRGTSRCLYAILDDSQIPEFEERLSDYTKIFGFKTSYFKVESADGVQVTEINK